MVCARCSIFSVSAICRWYLRQSRFTNAVTARILGFAGLPDVFVSCAGGCLACASAARAETATAKTASAKKARNRDEARLCMPIPPEGTIHPAESPYKIPLRILVQVHAGCSAMKWSFCFFVPSTRASCPSRVETFMLPLLIGQGDGMESDAADDGWSCDFCDVTRKRRCP